MKALLVGALCALSCSSAASAATLIKIHAEGTATGFAGAGPYIYSGQPIIVDATFDLSDGTRTTVPGLDRIDGAGEADVALDFLSGTWGQGFSVLGFFDATMTSTLAFSLLDPSSKHLMTMVVNRTGHQFASLDTPPTGEICAGANACYGAIVDPNGGTALDDVTLAWSTVSLSVENTAVPEPATWALMILGFGATGAMLRRYTPSVSSFSR